MAGVIDFHTHWIPVGLPDVAGRTGDPRWPAFDPATGALVIDGKAVRSLPSAGWDAQARLDAMDEAGHERHVLSPVPPLLCDWADAAAGARPPGRQAWSSFKGDDSRPSGQGPQDCERRPPPATSRS